MILTDSKHSFILINYLSIQSPLTPVTTSNLMLESMQLREGIEPTSRNFHSPALPLCYLSYIIKI